MAKNKNPEAPGQVPGAPLPPVAPHGQHEQNELNDPLAGRPPMQDANMAETIPPNLGADRSLDQEPDVKPPAPGLNRSEDLAKYTKAELPPDRPPAPKMMQELATGSVPTNLPSENGRFKWTPEFGPEIELTKEQADEIDSLAHAILMADVNVAADPKTAGALAYDRAVAIVTQARDAGRDHVMAKHQRRDLSPVEAKHKAAREERQQQAYLGADLAANPRAYARDPNDPSDQGPAVSIPIDWRAIQDEEGRRSGAKPALN